MINKLIYSAKSLFRLMTEMENFPNIFNYLVKKPVLVRLKNGISLYTNQPIELITIKETILDDEYKISQVKNLKNVVDVGAGLGDFSILVAKRFPGVRITAFEPNKTVFNLFKKNLSINKITNVKIYNMAVGRKKNYFLYLAAANVHGSTIKNYRAVKKVKVKGGKLSDFISQKVDYLKVDCEGAEIDVLKSLGPNKFTFIRRIMAEYHNGIIPAEDKKIAAILKKYHFKVQITKNYIVPTTGYIIGVKS